jgi:hypothetical protein
MIDQKKFYYAYLPKLSFQRNFRTYKVKYKYFFRKILIYRY